VSPASIRYRRAPYLLLEWEGEHPVVVNCDTLARCRADSQQIAALGRLDEWRTFAELAQEPNPNPVSEAGLDALVATGMVERRSGSDVKDRAGTVFWNPFDLAVHRQSNVGRRGVARQPGAEGARPSGAVFALPTPAGSLDGSTTAVLARRRSIRRYGDQSLTLGELSTLLHHSAGVVRSVEHATLGELAYRPFPAVGARSPLELYVVASDVAGLPDGAHRYEARTHQLTVVRERDENHERVLRAVAAATGGVLNRDPPVVILVTAVFERTMAPYPGVGLGLIYKETGCLYQTLYLVATAMGLAPCAIGGGPERANALWLGLDPLIESQVGCFLIGPREPAPE